MAHVIVLKHSALVLYHLFLGNLQRQQFTETVTGKIETVLSTPFGWTVLLALSALSADALISTATEPFGITGKAILNHLRYFLS
jgi:hypothetical protein